MKIYIITDYISNQICICPASKSLLGLTEVDDGIDGSLFYEENGEIYSDEYDYHISDIEKNSVLIELKQNVFIS